MSKIYVIGSVSCSLDKIESAAEKFSKSGNYVKSVGRSEGMTLEDLIYICYQVIENWADIVVAVPKSIVNGTPIFGDGTTYEIEHAKSFKKPVLIFWD